MKKMSLLLVWGVVLGVTGCSDIGTKLQTTGDLIGSFNPQYNAMRMIPEKCAQYGFKPGTKEFAECSMRLHEAQARNSPILAPQTNKPFICTHTGNMTTCR